MDFFESFILTHFRKFMDPIQLSIFTLASCSLNTRSGDSIVSEGTAVYLGDGIFITAGHCAKKKNEERYDRFVSHNILKLCLY
jgi:hypothetical protein